VDGGSPKRPPRGKVKGIKKTNQKRKANNGEKLNGGTQNYFKGGNFTEKRGVKKTILKNTMRNKVRGP